eukprot:gene11919-12008_t
MGDSMLYRKASVATMCTQVARGLGLRIVSGEFQPGDHIPIESDLCVAYGVSRSTIREAIKKLASKGLIEVSPKVGTRVLHVAEWNLFDTDILNWRLYSNFNEPIIKEIYEVRLCLEPRACYLTASEGTAKQLDRVRRSMQNILSNRHHPKPFGDALAEFHLAILDGAGNNLMMSLGTYVKMIIRALFHFWDRNNVNFDGCITSYQEIVEAVLERQPEKAQNLMISMLVASRNCAIHICQGRTQLANVEL